MQGPRIAVADVQLPPDDCHAACVTFEHAICLLFELVAAEAQAELECDNFGQDAGANVDATEELHQDTTLVPHVSKQNMRENESTTYSRADTISVLDTADCCKSEISASSRCQQVDDAGVLDTAEVTREVQPALDKLHTPQISA